MAEWLEQLASLQVLIRAAGSNPLGIQTPYQLDLKVLKTSLGTVSAVGTLNGDLVYVGPILQGCKEPPLVLIKGSPSVSPHSTDLIRQQPIRWLDSESMHVERTSSVPQIGSN